MHPISYVLGSLTALGVMCSLPLPSHSTDGYSMGEVCTQDPSKKGLLRIREDPSTNAPVAGLASDGTTVVFLPGKRYYKATHDWFPVSVKTIHGKRIEGYAAGTHLC